MSGGPRERPSGSEGRTRRAHWRGLPGDIIVDRAGFKLFAPVTTMIVLSLVLSLIVWLMRR